MKIFLTQTFCRFVAVAIAVTATTANSSGTVRSPSGIRRAKHVTKRNDEIGAMKTSNRNLRSSYHLEEQNNCCFDGKCRQPGQWLASDITHLACMCNRDGNGDWENCQKINQERTIEKRRTSSPTTARERLAKFQNWDFAFDLLGSFPGAITDAGSIQSVGVTDLPSLEGQGVSYSLFNIEPCGINLPHTHPRATELIYVISGKDLRTAFVEENGAGSRTIVNNIGKGEVTFFPQGLIHYQQNFSCDSVTFISALNSEDPGVVTITTRFFELPEEAIAGSLGEKASLVDQLIDGLPDGPAAGRRECLKRCSEHSW